MRLILNIILSLLVGISYVCVVSAISLTYSNYNVNEQHISLFTFGAIISGVLGLGVLYLKDYLGFDKEE